MELTDPPVGGGDQEPKTAGMSSAKLIHNAFIISQIWIPALFALLMRAKAVRRNDIRKRLIVTLQTIIPGADPESRRMVSYLRRNDIRDRKLIRCKRSF